MMKCVRTILGDVPVGELGVIYAHEHTVSQPPRQYKFWEPDLILDDVAKGILEVQEFKESGGSCIVDATAIDYGRDVPGMVEISLKSGVHLVATSGFNKGAYFTPEIDSLSEEAFYEMVRKEATLGMDVSGHLPGVLKFGTGYNFMSPPEERAARAVCKVQNEMGLPLYTHTEIGTLALGQLALMRDEKVNLERVCIGHVDRNPDLFYIREILRSGVFVGIDQIGKIKYHTEATRIDLLKHLIKTGYGKRILVSGDMARRSYLRSYGGGPGFTHIVKSFIPRLREELLEDGFAPSKAESVVEDLLINNPRDFLEIEV